MTTQTADLTELDAETRAKLRSKRRERDDGPRGLGPRWAILDMAGRYGQSRLMIGLTNDWHQSAEQEYHYRAASRQFRALQRITRAIER